MLIKNFLKVSKMILKEWYDNYCKYEEKYLKMMTMSDEEANQSLKKLIDDTDLSPAVKPTVALIIKGRKHIFSPLGLLQQLQVIFDEAKLYCKEKGYDEERIRAGLDKRPHQMTLVYWDDEKSIWIVTTAVGYVGSMYDELNSMIKR
jgi:hypothetical protein